MPGGEVEEGQRLSRHRSRDCSPSPEPSDAPIWPPDVPPWPATLAEARMLQRQLRGEIRLRPLPSPPRLLAACDVAYLHGEDRAVSGVLLFRYPELEAVEGHLACCRIGFPYRPGFLSLREGPALLEAIFQLQEMPDLFLFDGQGIAHPEGVGLASHLGIVLRRPSIGCAKGLLVGHFDLPSLEAEKGAWLPLLWQGKPVGAVLRTRSGVQPIFVSPGHLITLEECISIVLACCRRYRYPEPLRQVHLWLRREVRGLGD